MVNAISLYEDVKDAVNKDQNGDLSIGMFNRLSRRAELRIIDWLTGDVAGIQPPEPWATQKNKDWLSPLLLKFATQSKDGYINKPEDYYRYDNFYIKGTRASIDCDDESAGDTCNTPIEILDGDKFNYRCGTYIEGLKPSLQKPIAKIIGNEFELQPQELGSVVLEYVRYPKFASIASKHDNVYNETIPDPANSQHYEWGEWAREPLIYFITNYFADHTREKAIKEFNNATGKTVRG